MKREILINGSQRETRVAILEDDRLVELLVDRPDHRRTVGDIYLGRVEAVLPGIQAAFVDIGLEKSAFLHASDLLEPDEDEEPEEEAEETKRHPMPRKWSNRRSATRPDRGGKAGGGAETVAARAGQRRRSATGAAAEKRSSAKSHRRRALPNIQDILKKGQTLLVQVTKEPISTKGCRVTAQISLPGRFLVYMPYASKVGVSRKIESREQRAKLREMVSGLLPKDSGGVIVRTVAEGVTEEHFAREIDSLLALWKKINRKKTFVGGRRRWSSGRPASPVGIIRDLFSAKVDALHVDSKELYNEIEQYLKQVDPELMSRVHLYAEPTPLFDKFDIEAEIRDLFKARVRAAHRRLADHPADRGAGLASTSTPGGTPARRTPRRPFSEPTSRRRERSRGRSGCATSAASSSATSSTWRPEPTGRRCSRSCAPTSAGTAPAPRPSPSPSSAWSK